MSGIALLRSKAGELCEWRAKESLNGACLCARRDGDGIHSDVKTWKNTSENGILDGKTADPCARNIMQSVYRTPPALLSIHAKLALGNLS